MKNSEFHKKMKVTIGMVHGRFQPFHKEQYEYVLSGLGKCQYLLIGITNPEPSEYQYEVTSDHRHLYDANPFTFFQRMKMVTGCLSEASIDLSRISIIPFHLYSPSKWQYYLPPPNSITHFVRVFSDWENKKIALFKKHGFKVAVIDKGVKKSIEATHVRELMKSGGDWSLLVPKGTCKIINQIKDGRM